MRRLIREMDAEACRFLTVSPFPTTVAQLLGCPASSQQYLDGPSGLHAELLL